ncbi:MAG: alpha/beta hydrolase [Chloroflexi bacterium]|nr:alpha/beta hydrolase [Chloroflexota bacterium]MCL5275863.1 alpha/beta hydrolase [Chloroflexota bacterium]
MTHSKSIYRSPAGEKAVMALYDAVLAQWPVQHETLHIPTRHGETFVIASGNLSDPALVLLHGAGSNSAIWGADVVKYSRRRHVIAVDLPGEAGRSTPSRPSWRSPAYAEWLDDMLNALGLQQPTLIGISQGGWTALKYATWKPERVARLVLMCPGGVTPDRLSFVFKAVPLSLLGHKGVEHITRSLFGDQPVPREAREYTHLIMAHFKARVGALPVFTDDELRRLTMPALLLLGARDPLRPSARIAARMQRLLPQLNTVMIPKAGHILTDTAHYIMPFLASTEVSVHQDVGRYGAFVALGTAGRRDCVDQLMAALAAQDDVATTKLVDFAVGLVNTPEGSERVRHYLLYGSARQRNYAALYFKRRGNHRVLDEAVARGIIDREQAYAE